LWRGGSVPFAGPATHRNPSRVVVHGHGAREHIGAFGRMITERYNCSSACLANVREAQLTANLLAGRTDAAFAARGSGIPF
jgi:hypothetical protein